MGDQSSNWTIISRRCAIFFQLMEDSLSADIFFATFKIQDFQKRFQKIPNIIELDHLTVSGDVHFGRNVTLRGTVIGTYRIALIAIDINLFLC